MRWQEVRARHQRTVGKGAPPQTEKGLKAGSASKIAAVEPAKSAAAALFSGQLHPKKQRKIVKLDQWVEIRIVDGRTVTTLYPPNAQLIRRGQQMLPPPEFVYRRLHFPDGVPPEYWWTCSQEPERRARGGLGTQRMTVETWLTVVEREKARADGHIGPTGVGNLPRAPEHGECGCGSCQRAMARMGM